MRLVPLPNRVLVEDLERGERSIGSIVLPDDNGKSSGIRARWARVHAVGSNVRDITPGQWVLIDHGRWTRAFNIADSNGQRVNVWGVDYPEGVLMTSDDEPVTEIHSRWV